jgi:hypothetical protein
MVGYVDMMVSVPKLNIRRLRRNGSLPRRYALSTNFKRCAPSVELTFVTGQAQYIRVPYADFNALKLPPGKEHEADFVLLAGESRLLLRATASSSLY